MRTRQTRQFYCQLQVNKLRCMKKKTLMIGDIRPLNSAFLDKPWTPLYTCICLFILLSKPSISLILDIMVIGVPVVSLSLVSNSPDETAWTWMDADDLLGVELGLELTWILCSSGRILYGSQITHTQFRFCQNSIQMLGSECSHISRMLISTSV